MPLDRLSVLMKARLKLAIQLSPFKKTHNLAIKLSASTKPQILLLDKLEVGIRETEINQIIFPSLSPPEVTSDFCPSCSETIDVMPIVHCEGVEDFTQWLREQLLYPEIEYIPLLGSPRKAGKSYRQVEVEAEDAAKRMETKEPDTNCIHGMKKNWCSTCSRKQTQNKERPSSTVDPFDLIFPILQPPLGENFDSPIAFPPGQELYSFQREGVRFLADRERALLGDEMGLGKSIQAIFALRLLVRMGKVSKGLLLCPRSVLTDWEKKLWDWAPEIRVIKVRGSKEQRQIAWNTPGHVYLTTYETFRQDASDIIAGLDEGMYQGVRDLEDSEMTSTVVSTSNGKISRFDFIVLDEIQKIKNPEADVAKATHVVDARIRWGLSGTPLENRLEDVISIFSYLKPGLLHDDYADRPLKVKETIKPYFLRRRKSEALPDLPEKVHDEVWLDLTPAQRETYRKAEEEGIVQLNEKGDALTVQHVLALITKLKQIVNVDPVSKDSCKLEYLTDKLEVITEEDDKALVFSQYPEKTLSFLEPALRQFNPLVYHGSLPDSERDRVVKKFQEEDEKKVLLISLRAGGLGLTLTRANYVFHFDRWWNPAVSAQAEDRAHRIGQKKAVFVTSLYTVDTVEERIAMILKEKKALFSAVIDDLTDTDLGNVLSEEDLFSLFNLEKSKPSSEPKTEGSRGAADPFAQVSPQGFEELIARLYEKMGYQVRLTPATRDQGVDIYAKRQSDSGLESLAIQCKHYPNRTVGVEHARALYGVIQADASLTKGVLCTSGEFSTDCKEFTSGKAQLVLFDGSYLRGLLEKYEK